MESKRLGAMVGYANLSAIVFYLASRAGIDVFILWSEEKIPPK